MSKYIIPWKTNYLDRFNFSLFLSSTFKVTRLVLLKLLKNFYIFAVIMDPFQTSILVHCMYFKYFLLNWRLKSMEMSKCLQNCRCYRTIISNYLSKVIKIKLKMIQIGRLFCSWLLFRKHHFLCGRLIIPLLTKSSIY